MPSLVFLVCLKSAANQTRLAQLECRAAAYIHLQRYREAQQDLEHCLGSEGDDGRPMPGAHQDLASLLPSFAMSPEMANPGAFLRAVWFSLQAVLLQQCWHAQLQKHQ